MYRNRLFLLLVCMAASWCSMAQSTFHFRFTDVATGVRVIPTHAEVTARKDNKAKQLLTQKDIADNGTADVQVTDGAYDITVSANGYKPIATWFEVKAQELRVNIKLDPEQPVKELTHDYIGALRSKNAMVITGFVTDNATGLPMDGVKVSSADDASSAMTDKRGYYVLQLPLARSEKALEQRGTLVFAKKGYTAEIRKRFDMWAEGDMVLLIKMLRGNGEHAVNIIEKRELHRDITKP